MTDRNKGLAQYWPEITDEISARKAAMQGVIAAGFVAIVTAILSIGGWFGTKPSTLIDALIFAGLSFGIRKMSRMASVLGLILYIIERIMAMSHDINSGGAVMTGFLILMFIQAIRGTFYYHKNINQA